ncbi:MAG: HAD-IIB family hydrolase [Thermoanaerobaculales bacterium]|jgi:sucrose-phosphate synthase|nr:HAD-IIB family hydrolase [Thermoanaerobaculales bacterium]
MNDERGLYIALISVHGLIRGTDAELGRDADTGGQIQYVLDLARALAERPDVDRVELMTRQVLSTNVDWHYGEPVEPIADKAFIIRLPCGPHRYLRKESLWPYLPQFTDEVLQHFRRIHRVPDVIHSHYADAGAIGVRLSRLLDTTLVHTGHSLGKSKQQRLLDKGTAPETIENRYRMSRRIAAEKQVLAEADLVVASTDQEVEEQWGQYEGGSPSRMLVIPPGVDLDRFSPPRRGDRLPDIAGDIDRFLSEPKKPLILALQRPDERKNLSTLIRAYAEHDDLRRRANLALVIGTRDDITKLPKAQRTILTDMLLLIDRYDLYGSVAYPKSHRPEDVPDLYRLAAKRRGVFVNPALTEPFGLTLIEAAASGLPVVATDDGGPTAIIGACRNGLLVDALDAGGVAEALHDVVTDPKAWRRQSKSGIRGAHGFSWSGHVDRYLKAVRRRRRARGRRRRSHMPRHPLVLADRLLVCDIDNTLTGDHAALDRFRAWLEAHRGEVAFGIATGRVLSNTIRALKQWEIPRPDVLITAVGSEVYYGRNRFIDDVGWRRLIDRKWEPARLRELLAGVPGIRLQPKVDQRPFKLSYFIDSTKAPSITELRRRIRSAGLEAQLIYSHEAYLDLLPARASKGGALKYLAHRWGLPLEHLLVAGDSGNDAEMLTSGAFGIVVGNYSPELGTLRGRDGVYFAEAEHADGILEGIRHFGFVDGVGPAGDETDEE